MEAETGARLGNPLETPRLCWICFAGPPPNLASFVATHSSTPSSNSKHGQLPVCAAGELALPDAPPSACTSRAQAQGVQQCRRVFSNLFCRTRGPGQLRPVLDVICLIVGKVAVTARRPIAQDPLLQILGSHLHQPMPVDWGPSVAPLLRAGHRDRRPRGPGRPGFCVDRQEHHLVPDARQALLGAAHLGVRAGAPQVTGACLTCRSGDGFKLVYVHP